MESLKPCPRCGEIAEMNFENLCFRVCCPGCYNRTRWHNKKGIATSEWNHLPVKNVGFNRVLEFAQKGLSREEHRDEPR